MRLRKREGGGLFGMFEDVTGDRNAKVGKNGEERAQRIAYGDINRYRNPSRTKIWYFYFYVKWWTNDTTEAHTLVFLASQPELKVPLGFIASIIFPALYLHSVAGVCWFLSPSPITGDTHIIHTCSV